MKTDKELIERLRRRAGEVLDFAFKKEGAPGLVSIPRNANDVDALLCKAASRLEALSSGEAVAWKCAAISDRADCGWPFCGCDPKAEKVLESIAEHDMEIVQSAPIRIEAQLLKDEVRRILTETCRGELHAATASIVALIPHGAALSSPMPSGEEVARVIDGPAFASAEKAASFLRDFPQNKYWSDLAQMSGRRCDEALAIADRVLSLFSSSLGGGKEEEGTASRADLSPASRSQDQHSDGGRG